MGILNAQPAQKAAPGASQDLTNPILEQIQDGIEAAVPKELKRDYLAIVVSGMTIMFSKETSKFMDERLAQSQDTPTAVASGIADLMLLIYNESKKTMSIPAGMLASFSLMCEALDYGSKIGKIEIDQEIVTACTDATWKAVTEKFGMSQEKINQVIAQGQQGQADQSQAAMPVQAGA